MISIALHRKIQRGKIIPNLRTWLIRVVGNMLITSQLKFLEARALTLRFVYGKNKNCKFLQTQHKDINECIGLLVTSGKLSHDYEV